MKFSTKISYSGWIRNLVFLAVIVLFAFDVRTFLGNVLPISVITSGVFLILTACFYFLFLFPYRDQIAKVNIGIPLPPPKNSRIIVGECGSIR